MGKRFAIVIGVAAAGVMALGAQTATAAPDVVKYDTKLTITHERDTDRGAFWHGGLRSEVRKCMGGRRVILFKERRGPDRKLGSDRSDFGHGPGARWWSWGVRAPTGGRVYAKVRPEVGDGFVCRADRSRTIVNGAETATSSAVEPVDRTPPDLQLSGPKKQNPQADEVNDRGGRNVHLRVSCGDEACTARATGKLTNVKKGACGRSAHRSPCRKLSPNGPKVVPPGETRALGPELTKDSQCREVRKALADGKNVQAKITVRAKDAAGNVATAKRTIKLVK